MSTARNPPEAADRAIRLAAAGAVGASVVHELRNALAVVSTSLFLAKRDRADEARLVAHLEKATGEVVRAQQVVAAVLGLARGDALARESTPIAARIAAARSVVVLPTHVTFSVAVTPPDLAIVADPVLLERVFSNLYLNAIEALVGRARGAIETQAQVVDGRIELVVEDDGPGLDPSIMTALFDPLVTTKPSGTGLGLALVRAVAEAHGGDVEAGPRDDGKPGARFRLSFPA